MPFLILSVFEIYKSNGR